MFSLAHSGVPWRMLPRDVGGPLVSSRPNDPTRATVTPPATHQDRPAEVALLVAWGSETGWERIASTLGEHGRVVVSSPEALTTRILDLRDTFLEAIVIGRAHEDRVIAILTALRDRGVWAPALVLANTDDPYWIRVAQRLGARCAPPPVDDSDLHEFVSWHRRWRRSHLDHLVDTVGVRYRLSPRERQILQLATRGLARRTDIATALGVAENTVKTQVSRLLLKTSRLSLAEFAAELQWLAHGGGLRSDAGVRRPVDSNEEVADAAH